MGGWELVKLQGIRMEGGRNLHHLQPLETDTVLNYKLREGGTILARESGLG